MLMPMVVLYHGVVRMTMATKALLRVLLEDPQSEHYGLEIGKAAHLPSGTLYPILQRLEDAGWLTSDWERIDESVEGRRRRRYYRLTGLGQTSAERALVGDGGLAWNQ